MTKVSYVAAITNAMNICGDALDAESRSKLEALIGQLNKRNSATSTAMTKTQKENVGVKQTIVELLRKLGTPVTVTSLLSEPELTGFTNQKVSALLTQLINDGIVIKIVEKRQSLFKLADAPTEE